MNIDAYQDIRRIIREELTGLRMPELAVVQDIHPANPDNYACTVRLRDTQIVLNNVPVMTMRKGFASIPDIGDLVIVQYLGGSGNAPVIMGSFYNDEDSPPENAQGDARLRLPADAGDGSGVDVHVKSDDATSTRLAVGSSLDITLQDDDPVVSIDVGSGQAELVIDSDGTITIKSQKAVVLESGNDLSLKGTAVTIEASAELKLKGAVINLN